MGVGAMTSLVLTGPLLEMAVWRAGRGWKLYLAFALAALSANLGAFAVRGGAKVAGLDHLGGRLLAEWWTPALVSYAICGLAAGLVSAAIWFRLSNRGDSESAEAPT
jgi:hypothetical protein